MKLPLLQVDFYSYQAQLDKIQEEFDEFIVEEYQTDNELAECLDLITALFTFLTHSYSKDDLAKGIAKHTNKLKKRNWVFKGDIKLDIQYWD